MNAHASITDTQLPDPSAWATLAPAERFALAQLKRLRPNGLLIAELEARWENARRDNATQRTGYRKWQAPILALGIFLGWLTHPLIGALVGGVAGWVR